MRILEAYESHNACLFFFPSSLYPFICSSHHPLTFLIFFEC